ncbi:MAG: TerB family tellurite resistance protein [Gammaproteobacteria bacterium]
MDAVLRARLRRWFSGSDSRDENREATDLALAALLVELMRADYAEDPREHEAARRILARRFNLDREAAERLLAEGERAANHSVSLFKHTRALDVGLDEPEKFSVIEALWEIAYSDGTLDGNEDYLVHKVGDLLHVRHSDIMRLKDRIRRKRAGKNKSSKNKTADKKPAVRVEDGSCKNNNLRR